MYNKIKFGKANKLSYTAFRNGFYGYLNLLDAGKLKENALLTICDFTLSSNIKRMWVIDLNAKKVLFNTLVAHGMNTGEEFATAFSNNEDSHQSSLGFYTTAETYTGNNGYSLKLNGVDGIFNSKAYDRAIVIHGAEYVCDEFARCNKRIGRSHGCPALPVDIAPQVIDKIKDGNCLFIYFASKEYLSSSYWLHKKIKSLPQEADEADFVAGSFGNSANEESSSDDCLVTDKQYLKNKCAENTSTKAISLLPKKGKDISNFDKRIISSIVVINQNASGISDTTIVK